MRVFITGASSGIGRELAILLIGQGHTVWGIARRREKLAELQSKLGSDKFYISECDVVDIDASKKLASEMRQKGFIPDVVVLNAGTYSVDVDAEKVPFSARRAPARGGLDFEKFGQNMFTNLRGAIFWIAEFLPDFLSRGAGQFIAISSTSAYRPGKTSVGYPASKAALSMAFRGLRLNFGGRGVRFTTIHFGPIRTRMWAGSRSPLIPPPEYAAKFIVSAIGKKSGSYFYPFLSTFLFRLILFLPDTIFTKLGKILKK